MEKINTILVNYLLYDTFTRRQLKKAIEPLFNPGSPGSAKCHDLDLMDDVEFKIDFSKDIPLVIVNSDDFKETIEKTVSSPDKYLIIVKPAEAKVPTDQIKIVKEVHCLSSKIGDLGPEESIRSFIDSNETGTDPDIYITLLPEATKDYLSVKETMDIVLKTSGLSSLIKNY